MRDSGISGGEAKVGQGPTAPPHERNVCPCVPFRDGSWTQSRRPGGLSTGDAPSVSRGLSKGCLDFVFYCEI